MVALSVAALCAPVSAQTGTAPGGFVEKTNSTGVRSLLSAAQIQGLIPQRGGFLFPAPYGTQGIRITNASDCGGADCVGSVGYSYWNNMNNSAGSDTLLVVLGMSRDRGGSGPTLFSVNKVTNAVQSLGPLFDGASPYSYASGEGWYFSRTNPTALYMNSGPRLMRYDVISKQMQTVFDASVQYGSDRTIWQLHSSNDDRVHSATLRSASTYEMLGCMTYREDTRQYQFFAKRGDFDECQIDKSGRWLVIKENVDGLYGEDNRVIDLNNGTEQVLLDQNGAAGHSDVGFGYMVYSDNWTNIPGVIRVFAFGTDPMQAPIVSNSTDWNVSAPAHVSHSNSKAGIPLGQQLVCGSSANTTNSNRANEVICFRLDTSMDVLVVAPVMTDLSATGGGSDNYAKLPKGNIDPTGQYFLWTTNMGGARQDAFIAKIPSQLLTGSGGATPPPPGDTTPPSLSAVAASQVTSSGAVLGWLSSEAGDSQADYGTTTSYGSTTALDAARVTDHARALTGLAAGTLYHYRVRTRDAAGNLTVSGDFTFTTAASAVPPSIGPVGYWSLDEASGITALDSSGNGDNGALVNGPTRVAGRFGSALAFDGADDAVSVPHTAVLNAYPLTISLWMKTTSTSLSGLVNKYLPASMSGYQVFTSGGNLCAWYFRDNANYIWDGTGCTLSAPGFNDGAWHHVTFVVDASGGRLFVDGQQRISHPWTGTPGPTVTTQPVNFARYPGITLPCLSGQMDDVRIYNRALAASDILSLYGAPAGTGTTGTVTPDSIPPVISGVTTTGLASSSVTINWTTNEAADSQIDYGGTTSYGPSTTRLVTLVTAHSQALAGLTPGTLYHYRIRARDAAGNLTLSGDATFTTPAVRVVPGDVAPPVISLLTFTPTLARGLMVTWRTSETADTQVEFGTTTACGSLAARNATLAITHSSQVNGLLPSMTYYGRVRSRDAAGNLALSPVFTFRTSR